MRTGVLAAVVLSNLTIACAAMHGPTSFTLTTEELERRIEADLSGTMEVFRGIEVRRPQVTLMPVSNRLQLEWNVALPGTGEGGGTGLFGSNLGMIVALVGKPVLSASGTQVVLSDVHIEDVRFSGLPRLLGLAQLVERKGTALTDLPLVSISPGQLRKLDVAYQATSVEVTYSGLKVDIAPR